MALPIVHATAGYLVYRLEARRDRRPAARSGWPRAFAFMALANLPDADFVVGLVLGRPGDFHRGISHTVLAALVVGAALATLASWRRRERWWPAALTFAAVYGSHLVVDALTIDARGPAGARFFWPLSDAYFIFPFTSFGEILIDGGSRRGFLASIMRWPTVVVLAREAMVAAAAVVLLNLLEGRAFGPARGGGLEVTLAPEAGEEDAA